MPAPFFSEEVPLRGVPFASRSVLYLESFQKPTNSELEDIERATALWKYAEKKYEESLGRIETAQK